MRLTTKQCRNFIATMGFALTATLAMAAGTASPTGTMQDDGSGASILGPQTDGANLAGPNSASKVEIVLTDEFGAPFSGASLKNGSGEGTPLQDGKILLRGEPGTIELVKIETPLGLVTSKVFFGKGADVQTLVVTYDRMTGEAIAVTPQAFAAMQNAPSSNFSTVGGETCATATVIATLPFSDASTTAGHIQDHPTCGSGPDVAYVFTPAANVTAQISLCGSSFDTEIHVHTANTCLAGNQIACNDDFCGLQSQVTVAMTAGTSYYIVISGFAGGSGAYTLNVTVPAALCSSDPCQINAPNGNPNQVILGNTTGCGNQWQASCSAVTGGLDAVVNYTPTTGGLYIIDTCASTLDTVLAVHTANNCLVEIPSGCNDDACGATGFSSSVAVNLTANTAYQIVVDGFSAGDFGPFTLNIHPFQSCVGCTDTEGEPTGSECPPGPDTFNGGCNSTPNVFSTLPASGVVCGEWGSPQAGFRDTDWYNFNLAVASHCVWTVNGDRLTAAAILSNVCPPAIISNFATSAACPAATAVAIADLTAGAYRLFAAPNEFGSTPCGAKYQGTLVCTPIVTECVNCTNNEPEPCGQDTNGGCNSGPPIFGNVTCNTTVCGNFWADGNVRDTDWFHLTIPAGGATVTWSVVGEAPYQSFYLSNFCAPAILATATGGFCGAPGVIGPMFLDQGLYTFFVSTQGFAGFPCSLNAQYTATINCILPPPSGACCQGNTACSVLTQTECAALNRTYRGDGTDCGDFMNPVLAGAGTPFATIVGGPGTTLAPIASNSDDNGDLGINIGFHFNFYGDDHTHISISSNGYLTFGSTVNDFTPDPIPTVLQPNNLIAPNWADYNSATAGDVFYQTAGTAPNRRFTVQWNQIPYFGTLSPLHTFQAVLYETTNCIDLKQVSAPNPAQPVARGVENQTGTVGTNAGPPLAGQSIRLCPSIIPNPAQFCACSAAPTVTAALAPAGPCSASSPQSGNPGTFQSGTFTVVCTALNCDGNAIPATANLVITYDTGCATPPVVVPVACGDIVNIHLAGPACPLGPVSPASPSSPGTVPTVTGFAVHLEVTATDANGTTTATATPDCPPVPLTGGVDSMSTGRSRGAVVRQNGDGLAPASSTVAPAVQRKRQR